MLDQDADLGLLYQSEFAEPDWYKTNIPCQVGCPARTDVSNYIGLISQGRFDEAYVLNRRSNVVPGVLGRTCARPCEPVCRRNKVDGKPVSICWLKRAAHDHREYRYLPERPAVTKSEKIAIIGAGSAGVACARELAEMGYPVTVFDMYPAPGGMMVGGIPVWRLPREVTQEEIDEYLEALGVEVKLNTFVGKDVQLTDLLNEYAAVYIGAGTMLSNPLTGPDNKVVPGADYHGVIAGLPFLEKVNASSCWAPASPRWTAAAPPSASAPRRSSCSTAARRRRCPPTSMRWMRRCWSMSSSSISARQSKSSALTASMSAA